MKTCKWCGEKKTLDLFPKHKQMADGHLNKCKSCLLLYVNAHRKTEAGKAARAKEKQYPAAKLKYKKSEKGKAAAARHKIPKDREAANNAVRYALRRGKIFRQPCFECGQPGMAHHSSYAADMRLCVTWLCVHHHNLLHVEHDNKKTWSKNLINQMTYHRPSPGVTYTCAVAPQ